MRIEHRPTLRTRIKQARNLGGIQIVQIREGPAGSDHPVRGELIGDAHIPGIVKLAGKRRNHRLIRLLDPAGNAPADPRDG